jgi:hypothetical protein
MTTGRHQSPLSRLVKAILALEILLSIGALGGGLVLIVAPRGEIMPLPLSALAGSPFESYFGPGVILFTVLGLGPLIAARLAWIRHPLAPMAAFVVAAALLIWFAVEIAIIGYSNEPPLAPGRVSRIPSPIERPGSWCCCVSRRKSDAEVEGDAYPQSVSVTRQSVTSQPMYAIEHAGSRNVTAIPEMRNWTSSRRTEQDRREDRGRGGDQADGDPEERSPAGEAASGPEDTLSSDQCPQPRDVRIRHVALRDRERNAGTGVEDERASCLPNAAEDRPLMPGARCRRNHRHPALVSGDFERREDEIGPPIYCPPDERHNEQSG